MTVRADPRTKGGLLRRSVAEALLAVTPGERMPTVRSLAGSFGASVGATQAALAGLERDGALTTEPRGRAGTVMVERSVGSLWAAARQEPLVVALPLPSTRTVHALATGLKAAFADAGVDAYLEFIRGSRNRLAALRGGRCHAVVMSALAADGLDDGSATAVVALAPGSFVFEHRVYVRSGTAREAIGCVGYDPDSYDFERITDLEFGDPVERTRGPYMWLAEALTAGGIDAVILDAEESFVSLGPGVESRPLSAATQAALGGRNTAAVLVARPDDAGVASVMRACLGSQTVGQVQADVLAGRLTPSY